MNEYSNFEAKNLDADVADKKLADLFIPSLFVSLWSTGFIVGRMIVDSASPNIFLAFRFFLSFLLFLGISKALKKQWPPLAEWHKHAVAGFFINGIYLGASYWAIAQGLPAALMALLGALQPILTMVIGIVFVREQVSFLRVTGMTLGIAGVFLVLLPSIAGSGQYSFSFIPPFIAFGAILSITWGTILQKKSIAKSELLPSLAIQNASAAATSVFLAFLLGESNLVLNGNFIFSLTWAVCILSGLGTYLFIFLVRNGSATHATSLMLLAPPLAALEARFLFGDQLTPLQIIGFALALLGVVLCRRK